MSASTPAPDPHLAAEPLALARAWLLAARQGRRDTAVEARLARLDADQLAHTLASDDARKVFWIDVYHGVVLHHELGAASGALGRLRHFGRPFVTIAGQRLSLDDIEHGLLRRSRWKLGLGFAVNPLPSRFERAQRVARLDPRIHFALNCGAVSCPRMATYEPGSIDHQLERAAATYLRAETLRLGDGLAVPTILLWYMGDFGGPRGLRRLLRHHGIEGWSGRLRFRSYDWTPDPGLREADPDPWASGEGA